MVSRLQVALFVTPVAAAALMAACSAPDPGALTVYDPIQQPRSGGSSTSSSSGGAMVVSLFPAAFKGEDPGQDTAAITGHGIGTSNFGLDCTICHKAGGTAAGKIFKAAGSVYDGAGPAKNFEVIIKGATGTCAVSTDKSGNFWCEVDFGANAKTAVRNGAKESAMTTPLTSGACTSSTCHNSTTNKVDFVP